ncbi:MAG: autotransporter-associated beta strand repeat-containing protein [Pirellulales bacterium]
MCFRTHRMVLLFLACLILGSTESKGQYTWTGNSGTNWTTAGNWTGGVPVSGQNTTLTFGSTAQSFANNDIATNPFVLNSLTVNSAAPASWLIIGNPLSFRTSTGNVLPTFSVASGKNVVVRNAIILTNNTTFDIAGTGSFDMDGNTSTAIISGAGQLTKTGAGTMYLGDNIANNLNSYTGATSIQDGTVQVDSIGNAGVNSSLGAGSSITLGSATTSGTLYANYNFNTNRSFSIAAGGGAITVSGFSNFISGQLSGSGKLSVTGVLTGYDLSLSANNSGFTGQIDVSNVAKLIAANANALGSGSAGVTLNRGVLELSELVISGKTLTMNPVGVNFVC